MYLSIVIAVYNEEKNIEELTHRIYKTVPKIGIPFEVIYAIDGNDDSSKIAYKLQKKYKSLKVDYSTEKRGYTKAFKKGFSMINKKCTHIQTMDADLNHQPEEIKDFVKLMKETKVDLIVGSRYMSDAKIENLPLWKRLVSKLANFIIDKFWHLNVKDKTSGFRLYKKDVCLKCFSESKTSNFEVLFEVLLLAAKKGYIIKETKINFIARKYGESKFQMFRVIKGYIRILFLHFGR